MRIGTVSIVLLTGFLFIPVSSSAQEAFYLFRQPYLQQLQVDQVIIVWHTSLCSFGKVEFGQVEPGEIVIESSSADSRHEVLLTDLAPGTTYSYRVVGTLLPDAPLPPDGVHQLASDTYRFRTSPRDKAEPVRAMVFGDAGAGTPEQLAVRDVVIQQAPDLVLVTGDLVYPFGSDEAYQSRFFDVYANLLSEACVYPAIGNHDAGGGSGRASYERQFVLPANNPQKSESYYSFDFGAAHFISIDATETFVEEEVPQLEWIKSDLKSTTQPWKIVIMHHPVYTTGPHAYDRFKAERRAALTPVFDRFGVDLVLSGHDHLYERTFPVRDEIVRDGWQGDSYHDPRGTIYAITGGGGQFLYQRAALDDLPYAAAYASVHHSLELVVTDRQLSLRVHTTDGGILDPFTITKGNGRPAFSIIRGDVDNDQRLGLTDPVLVLNHLFRAAELSCPASAEFNGDARLDITDAINSLQHQFLGGAPPVAPFPDCGEINVDLDAFCKETPCAP